MDKIYDDVLCEILLYLHDKDKLNLMIGNKKLNELKSKIRFTSRVRLEKIFNLNYYHQFENILTDKIIEFPKNIKHLTFDEHFNQNITGSIPKTVTHLTFGYYFNQDIKGTIPDSVTDLCFGDCFDQDIEGAIPNSVKFLMFGYYFNGNINGTIPDGVTHLIFYGYNNDKVKGKIPRSVIYLETGGRQLKRLSEYYVKQK